MMLMAPILAGSATAASAGAVASGAAAAGFGAIGGGAAAGGFSLASALSGGLSLVSGLASIAQGNADAANLRDKAAWEDFNASRELTRGRQETVAALQAGNDAVAAAQVAGFASGLQSSGSVLNAKLDAIRDTEFNVATSRDEAMIMAGARRGEARRLREDAKSARMGGWMNAFGTWGSGLGRFARTG